LEALLAETIPRARLNLILWQLAQGIEFGMPVADTQGMIEQRQE